MSEQARAFQDEATVIVPSAQKPKQPPPSHRSLHVVHEESVENTVMFDGTSVFETLPDPEMMSVTEGTVVRQSSAVFEATAIGDAPAIGEVTTVGLSVVASDECTASGPSEMTQVTAMTQASAFTKTNTESDLARTDAEPFRIQTIFDGMSSAYERALTLLASDEPSPVAVPLAGTGHRRVAFIVDLGIVALISVLLTQVGQAIFGLQEGSFLLKTYLFVAVSLYFTFMQFNDGQTLGKKLMRIKVIDDQTGAAPDFVQIFFREVFGRWISAFPFAIGLMASALRVDRKAFHDRLFATSVIDVNSESQTPAELIEEFFLKTVVPKSKQLFFQVKEQVQEQTRSISQKHFGPKKPAIELPEEPKVVPNQTPFT